MAHIAVLLLLFVIIAFILLVFGIGLGFLLHWIVPRVDVGMAILIGLVTTVSTLHFAIRLMVVSGLFALEERAEEGAADLPAFFSPEPAPRPWRRTKRKKPEE
jgi:hypothetical protein